MENENICASCGTDAGTDPINEEGVGLVCKICEAMHETVGNNSTDCPDCERSNGPHQPCNCKNA